MNEPTDQEIKESMFSLLNQLEITIKEEIKPIDQQFNGSDQCLAHVEFNQRSAWGTLCLGFVTTLVKYFFFPPTS